MASALKMKKAANVTSLDVRQRIVQIPTIGDIMVLDEPWTFTLHHEYRNETLLAVFGINYREVAKAGHSLVTLPEGTELRVSRIYIRNGASDFDSVTFFGNGLRKKNKDPLPSVPDRPRCEFPEHLKDANYVSNWDWNKRNAWYHEREVIEQAFQKTKPFKDWQKAYYAREEAKRLRRPVRFWVKLPDVNKMVVRSSAWSEREKASADTGKTRAIALE